MAPSSKPLHDFSELIQLLPESIQKELLKQEKSASKGKQTGKGSTVRVALDTKGRKGKKVTIISGFQHNPATMNDIAKILKQHCGAGGTVKGMTIEIQGDQRATVSEKLREMEYKVK